MTSVIMPREGGASQSLQWMSGMVAIAGQVFRELFEDTHQNNVVAAHLSSCHGGWVDMVIIIHLGQLVGDAFPDSILGALRCMNSV